jgi:hypothetical protein
MPRCPASGGKVKVSLLSCWTAGNCLAGGLDARMRVMLDGKWQPWIYSPALCGKLHGVQSVSCLFTNGDVRNSKQCESSVLSSISVSGIPFMNRPSTNNDCYLTQDATSGRSC